MRHVISCMCILTILLCGCAKKDAKENTHPSLILRYADNQPPEYPTTKAAYRFAQLVQERTGGKVAIKIYADGELGGEKDVLEQIQFGGVDFSRFSLGTLTDLAPSLGVLQLPYLYDDDQHMWRVLDGPIGDQFLCGMTEDGIIGLAWFDAGVRSLYTTFPVRHLEDLAGKRIRVQESSMMSRTISCLQVVTEQIPYSLVYSALQQGKIDGAENNLPSYYSKGHYALAPYFFNDEHFRVPEIIMMSIHAKEKIDALDPSFGDIIRQCAKESALYERELWKEEVEKAKSALLSKGCVITEPSPEEKAKFKTAMAPMYKEYATTYGELILHIQTQ